jgi:hypothetical protein
MYKIPSLLIFAAALQACSVSTITSTAVPTVGTAYINAAAQSTVITNGNTITLPAQSGSWGVASNPVYADATTLAGGIREVNSMGYAGRQNGTYFAGFNGVGITVPTTGSAALLGQYYVVDAAGARDGIIGLNADFAAGTIAGVGGTGANAVSAVGTISGGNVSGTVTYKGSNGVWKGGFFLPPSATLSYEMMSGFVGTDFSGIIAATR